MKPIRDLRADEIDCRVQSVKEKGLVLLLYKDARVDMNILDETFGAENWQREHYECKGNLFCRIGVKLGGEWVWKSDCGTESNTEAQKGEASDSFKRSGFCWGIGRELYTAPFIWVPGSKCEIKKDNKGKLVCYDEFVVTSITISEKKIIDLTIYNKTMGCVAYDMSEKLKKPAKAPEKPKADPPKRETEKNIEHAVQKAEQPKKKPEQDEEIKTLRAELNKKAKEIMSVTGFDSTKVNEILCDKCSINQPIIKEDYQQLLIAAGVMLGELYDRKD